MIEVGSSSRRGRHPARIVRWRPDRPDVSADGGGPGGPGRIGATRDTPRGAGEAMSQDRLYERYRELQAYLEWTEADARRVVAAAPLLDPHLTTLIDDFYAEIGRHPEARMVITGGPAQIDRLRGSL